MIFRLLVVFIVIVIAIVVRWTTIGILGRNTLARASRRRWVGMSRGGGCRRF
jgi:hypothetical protein